MGFFRTQHDGQCTCRSCRSLPRATRRNPPARAQLSEKEQRRNARFAAKHKRTRGGR